MKKPHFTNTKNPIDFPMSVEEMMDCMKRPGNRRSLAELNTVIEEILDRNPEFAAEIDEIVKKSRGER